MKITIVSGGSGSVQLKKGLSEYVPVKNVFTLVNAYDNGLSTGLVRKVFNGDILGPSDIRKQQLLDYENYRDEVKTEKTEKLFKALKERATFFSKPKEEFLKIADTLPEFPIFRESIELFFEQPMSRKIKYIDFSIANIFYGALMYKYGAQSATDKVAKMLNLPCNIIINSDENVFLGAITENNYRIMDEGDIVQYNNPTDRIADILLFNKNGEENIPTLSKRAEEVLADSDLVVLSSGTQFSSLIPTYITKGFNDAISDKLVYMIRNIDTDQDMTGYTLAEQDDLVKKYVRYDKSFADESLSLEHDIVRNIKEAEGIHSPAIAYHILDEFYGISGKDVQTILIDFDDTIISRGEDEVQISLKVKDLIEGTALNTCIVTGKPHREVNVVQTNSYISNYGCNFTDSEKKSSCSVLPNEASECIIEALKSIKFNFSKFENRDDSVISLRFLDEEYREVLHAYLNNIEELKSTDVKILKAGSGTIDIMRNGADKLVGINTFFSAEDISKAIYIGDEPEGNDKEVMAKLQCVKSFAVESPYDTFTILKYLEEKRGK